MCRLSINEECSSVMCRISRVGTKFECFACRSVGPADTIALTILSTPVNFINPFVVSFRGSFKSRVHVKKSSRLRTCHPHILVRSQNQPQVNIVFLRFSIVVSCVQKHFLLLMTIEEFQQGKLVSVTNILSIFGITSSSM